MRAKKGSALLVALVFTGLLTLVTIGVSALISRETRLIKNIIDGNTAYYAAESGIELAMLDVQENEPGFEIREENVVGLADGLEIKFAVLARTSQLPILADYERRLLNLNSNVFGLKNAFAELPLNASVKVPFTDELKNFRLEYYFPLAKEFDPVRLSQIDVLRFKLFGKNTEGGIDSLNDFLPANNGDAGITGLTAENPATSGTQGHWNNGIYFPADPERLDGSQKCAATGLDSDKQCMTFANFLATHTDNYLVISNLLDSSKLSRIVDTDFPGATSLYYRIIDIENQQNSIGLGNLVSPTAKINASGEYRGSKQGLIVDVLPDNFLPIFDFALYRPKTSSR